MAIYEQCSKCYGHFEETDYISGIGLVCKKCSKIIRKSEINQEESTKEDKD